MLLFFHWGVIFLLPEIIETMKKIVVLAIGFTIFISCKPNKEADVVSKKNTGVVQEYVKDRDDWKPNPGHSEIMILDGYAIGGYDPVSYFNEKPEKGDESIAFEWKGAKWLFTSDESRQLFKANPEQYAPQYGGWSVRSLSGTGGEGFAAQSMPESAWLVSEGKLYFFGHPYSIKMYGKYPEYLKKDLEQVELQWPRIRKEVLSGAKVFWPKLASRNFFDSHEVRPVLSQTEIMVLKDGYAIGGYDPVAYFKASEARKGKESIAFEWNDAKWLFSSEEYRDLFKASPEKYAPQYGGWCAYGISGHNDGPGYGAQSRPEDSWTIIDDKLYFNWNPGVTNMFLKEKEAFIKQGDIEWERIRKELLDGGKVHWKYF